MIEKTDKSSNGDVIRWVLGKLEEAYSEKVTIPSRNALEELIFSILLQGSTNERALEALRNLKDEFHDWNEVRVTIPVAIAKTIHGVGLEKTKAMRLVKIFQSIFEDRSDVDIEFLEEMSDSAVMNYLCGMEGVGEHSVLNVLTFALKKHFFPQTKAAGRFAERFEFEAVGKDISKLRAVIEDGVPEGKMAEFIVLLDYHTEHTCLIDRPKCTKCVLNSKCRVGKKKLARNQARRNSLKKAGKNRR